MTSYITITDAEVQPEAPITSELMTKLRDNPVAISEGAAGAPKIEQAAMGTWYTTAGGVGTYMFAIGNTSTNTTYDFGGTASGSQLDPCGLQLTNVPTDYNLTNGLVILSTVNPSGTWKCMGYAQSTTAGRRTATLWLRIS